MRMPSPEWSLAAHLVNALTAHCVDPSAIVRPKLCSPNLGRAVGAHHRLDAQARRAGNVDDRATRLSLIAPRLLSAHLVNGVSGPYWLAESSFGHIESTLYQARRLAANWHAPGSKQNPRTRHIHVERLLPHVVRLIRKLDERPKDAGATQLSPHSPATKTRSLVHDDVQPAPLGHSRLDHALNVLRLRDIGFLERRLPALLDDLAMRCVAAFRAGSAGLLLHVDAKHLSAFRGETERDGPPIAGSRPRHQRDLSFESFGHGCLALRVRDRGRLGERFIYVRVPRISAEARPTRLDAPEHDAHDTPQHVPARYACSPTTRRETLGTPV
jgi:hypothetical protein